MEREHRNEKEEEKKNDSTVCGDLVSVSGWTTGSIRSKKFLMKFILYIHNMQCFQCL